MSSYNSANITDLVSVRDLIEPVAGSATYTTDYIDAGTACQWMAIISAGAVTGTVDAKIEQATDSSGTGVKDLSGSDITQLVAAGSALIEFQPSDLDTANDFDHVRLSITTSNAADVASGQLISRGHRYEPQAQGSKIDEEVTV
jgi:hypothetical protein